MDKSEYQLIAAIKEWAGGAFIGDDCALLPSQTLITSDTLVEGNHFVLNHISLDDLGWKAVSVNLSDIAAMAGRPRYLVINLTIPEAFSRRDLEKLYLSMVGCARTYRCPIVGGDLTGGPVLVISLTVVGDTHELGCLYRNGAKPGDIVAVTGDFGASQAGLWALTRQLPGYLYSKRRHTRPVPRLAESWQLIEMIGERGALMDASDGLADALFQIARVSRVGMSLDLSCLPIHFETTELAKIAGLSPLDWALYGGEDYELVACLSEDSWHRLSQGPNNPFTAIGRVTDSNEVKLSCAGALLPDINPSKMFQHWRNEPSPIHP